jgi:hypothetical protein
MHEYMYSGRINYTFPILFPVKRSLFPTSTNEFNFAQLLTIRVCLQSQFREEFLRKLTFCWKGNA